MKRNKKTIVAIGVLLLVSVAAVFAAGTSETDKLWNQADKLASESQYYMAGEREITLDILDDTGTVASSASAQVSLTTSHYGRTLNQRTLGSTEVLDLLTDFSDGAVITPFIDNAQSLSYEALGTEIIDGTTTQKYKFSYKLDPQLLIYDSYYEPSEDTLTIKGSIWIDEQTGAIVKLENNFTVALSSGSGKHSLKQTVEYDIASADQQITNTPAKITWQGTTTEYQFGSSYTNYTTFVINEVQNDFFRNPVYKRGTQS